MRRKNVAKEKRLVALVLCKMLGIFGAHRFYVGKNTSAVIQLLTAGGLGIWTLVDFIMILFGVFTNAKGQELIEWT